MHTIKMIRHLAIFVSLSGIFPFSMQVAQAEPALTSIEVTPSNPSIDITQTLQFSATGTFDDGSSRLLGGDVWTPGTPLLEPHSRAGVAVLDGNFYVVGGRKASDVTTALAAVNRYNPSTDTWTTLSPLQTGRMCPAAAVAKGVLYAVGGWNVETLNTVEAYLPASDTWSTKAPLQTLRGCIKTSVVNGILYAIGNSATWTVAIEAYDPATNTWSAKATLSLPKKGEPSISYFATATLGGAIYVIGGTGVGGALTTVYAYHPITDMWSTKAPMPTPRWDAGAGVVNGLLIVAGGSNSNAVEAYNPKTNTWTTLGSLLYPGDAYVAQEAVNGKLYALTMPENSTDANPLDIWDMFSYTPPEALWTSSNASIATTDGRGFVTTSILPGASTITATVGAASGSSTLTTLPVPVRGLRVRTHGDAPGTVTSGSGIITDGSSTLPKSGIICPGDCTEKYVRGTTVVLTAIPQSEILVTWRGDCEGHGNTCTLVMDDNHEVTAVFTHISGY